MFFLLFLIKEGAGSVYLNNGSGSGRPKKYGSYGSGSATQQQTILDASQHPPQKWILRVGIRSIVELRTVHKTRPHRLYLFGISFNSLPWKCES